MHSTKNSEITPNVWATVAPPWSVVTRPDRSRSGTSAPPAQMAVPTAIVTGLWWCPSWASTRDAVSHAAAPERAWDGPATR